MSRPRFLQPVPGKSVAWWQAAIGLVVGGVGAQLMGAVPIVIGVVYLLSTGVAPVPAELEPAVQGMLRSFWVLGPSIALTGGSMAAAAALVVLLSRVPMRRGLGLRSAPWPAFVAAPFGILALGPTSDLLRRLMQEYLPHFTLGSLEGLDAVARSAPIWIVVPAMALVPGFAEELLFRGMFQGSIERGRDQSRLRTFLALTLSGLLFAAYHTDPHHVAAVIPLGLYLAWLRHRTGSVLVPITAHVANNAAAVLATVYLVEEGAADEALPLWYTPVGWLIAGLAMAAVAWSTREAPAPAPEPVPAPAPAQF